MNGAVDKGYRGIVKPAQNLKVLYIRKLIFQLRLWDCWSPSQSNVIRVKRKDIHTKLTFLNRLAKLSERLILVTHLLHLIAGNNDSLRTSSCMTPLTDG